MQNVLPGMILRTGCNDLLDTSQKHWTRNTAITLDNHHRYLGYSGISHNAIDTLDSCKELPYACRVYFSFSRLMLRSPFFGEICSANWPCGFPKTLLTGPRGLTMQASLCHYASLGVPHLPHLSSNSGFEVRLSSNNGLPPLGAVLVPKSPADFGAVAAGSPGRGAVDTTTGALDAGGGCAAGAGAGCAACAA